MTGLTNGHAYLCSVVANNAAGDSAPSNATSVTPLAVPDAPTGLRAQTSQGQALLYFNVPVSDGGTPITRYETVCSSGAQAFGAIGPGAPLVVSGLTDFTTYSCTVLARNALGDGPASAPILVTPPFDRLLLDGFEGDVQ